MKYLFGIFTSIALTSCSIQQTHYDASLSVAAKEERNGNMQTAEENYKAAVARAKNHLGNEEISSALYNIGSFYRRQSNYASAIASLKDSVLYANKAPSLNPLELGRRYIALSACYAELGTWNDGKVYLQKLTPYWSQYTGDELSLVKAVFTLYYKNLTAAGLDTRFIPEAAIIRISPVTRSL